MKFKLVETITARDSGYVLVLEDDKVLLDAELTGKKFTFGDYNDSETWQKAAIGSKSQMQKLMSWAKDVYDGDYHLVEVQKKDEQGIYNKGIKILSDFIEAYNNFYTLLENKKVISTYNEITLNHLLSNQMDQVVGIFISGNSANIKNMLDKLANACEQVVADNVIEANALKNVWEPLWKIVANNYRDIPEYLTAIRKQKNIQEEFLIKESDLNAIKNKNLVEELEMKFKLVEAEKYEDIGKKFYELTRLEDNGDWRLASPKLGYDRTVYGTNDLNLVCYWNSKEVIVDKYVGGTQQASNTFTDPIKAAIYVNDVMHAGKGYHYARYRVSYKPVKGSKVYIDDNLELNVKPYKAKHYTSKEDAISDIRSVINQLLETDTELATFQEFRNRFKIEDVSSSELKETKEDIDMKFKVMNESKKSGYYVLGYHNGDHYVFWIDTSKYFDSEDECYTSDLHASNIATFKSYDQAHAHIEDADRQYRKSTECDNYQLSIEPYNNGYVIVGKYDNLTHYFTDDEWVTSPEQVDSDWIMDFKTAKEEKELMKKYGCPISNDSIFKVMYVDTKGNLHDDHDINESKATESKICCICKKPFTGYGNNPDPVCKTGRCCDECNNTKVLKARIEMLKKSSKKNESLNEAYGELIIDDRYPEEAEYSHKIYLPTDTSGKVELKIFATMNDTRHGREVWDINVDLDTPSQLNAHINIDETKLADYIDNYGHPYLSSYDFDQAEEVCENVREYFNDIDQDDFYRTFVEDLGCDPKEVEKLWIAPEDTTNPVNKLDRIREKINKVLYKGAQGVIEYTDEVSFQSIVTDNMVQNFDMSMLTWSEKGIPFVKITEGQKVLIVNDLSDETISEDFIEYKCKIKIDNYNTLFVAYIEYDLRDDDLYGIITPNNKDDIIFYPIENMNESKKLNESTYDQEDIIDDLYYRGMKRDFGVYEDTVAYEMAGRASDVFDIDYQDAMDLAWKVISRMKNDGFDFEAGEEGIDESKKLNEKRDTQIPGQISIFDDPKSQNSNKDDKSSLWDELAGNDLSVWDQLVKKAPELNNPPIRIFEIVPEQKGTSIEEHIFANIERAKNYIKDANLTKSDIDRVEGADIDSLFESLTEGLSEKQIADILNDAKYNSDASQSEYYWIGYSAAAFMVKESDLFLLLPDHISEEDIEYKDMIRGYRDNNGYAYKNKEDAIDESLNEALEDYKITYYLSTATAERRPETIEDVENDWKEETFAADSDYDALLYALELIDDIFDDTDFSTAEEIVQYFEEKDLGDGSAFVIKLEGPNGIIYDMGYDKQSYIDEFVSEDSYDEVDEYDESLNEANIHMSKAQMAKFDREVDEATKEVAKYNIPMKAQKNSAGEIINIPDFDSVPENRRDAAKKAYDRYKKALEARPDRAKNIITYDESLNESYYQLSRDDFTVHYLGEDENLWNELIDYDDNDDFSQYEESLSNHKEVRIAEALYKGNSVIEDYDDDDDFAESLNEKVSNTVKLKAHFPELDFGPKVAKKAERYKKKLDKKQKKMDKNVSLNIKDSTVKIDNQNLEVDDEPSDLWSTLVKDAPAIKDI